MGETFGAQAFEALDEAKAAQLEVIVVDHHQCASLLPAAFAMARQHGRRGAVVLLSPACASFDQFRDFEQRGEIFTQLVKDFIAAQDKDGNGERRQAGGNGK